MSSTIIFKFMSSDRDYQFQLTEERCNWDNFSESLMAQSTEILETPLYYFDNNNTKQTIADASSFSAMVLDSANNEDNIIHLYSDNNAQGTTTATASEWVFAPEEDIVDGEKRSTQPDNSTPFSDLYSTCFRQLGQVIDKHGGLIESNPHLRVLISRFASSTAATPDAEMISRLDQWLTVYNKNSDKSATDNDSKQQRKQRKHRHCGRRDKEGIQKCGGRREIIASLPEDLAQFLLENRPSRYHHHHGRHQHPWMDQHHPTHPSHAGFIPSLWGGGIHKHKHKHHHHRHYHDEQQPNCSAFGAGTSGAFDPTANGTWGAHPLFGGRHEKSSMMCSRSGRHFEKAMKHHHHRHPYFFDAPTDSSSSSSDSTSSSSSENEVKNGEQKEAGSKRQQKKLWKALAKEHFHHGRFGGRGRHHHHRMHGPEGFYGYGRSNGPIPFFAAPPPLDGQVRPPPGYIEQSFGQMHLNDSKKQ